MLRMNDYQFNEILSEVSGPRVTAIASDAINLRLLVWLSVIQVILLAAILWRLYHWS